MEEKAKVLHLTHTDIFNDNRILKEIEALGSSGRYKLFAIGVREEGGNARTKLNVNAAVKLIELYSRRLHFLPRFLRHALNFSEMIIPMLILGLRKRPSIVHCHDTLVLPAGYLISLLVGAKLVYDAHELESDKNGQSKVLSLSTLIIEKICWSRIDLLISVSPSILKWYVEKFGYKKSALVLNSPMTSVDLMTNGSDDGLSYFHKKYSIPLAEKVFIYLGALESGRGIDILLKVFEDRRIRSHVVFVGQGSLSSRISAQARQIPTVHLHSAVPHEDVVGLVKSADFGLCLVENVSLSDYYCLPNKLFEYCFSGLPILASNFPDISEVVDKHCLGRVAKPNISSVLDAISEIERKPASFEPNDLIALSWQAQASRLLAAYAEIGVGR